VPEELAGRTGRTAGQLPAGTTRSAVGQGLDGRGAAPAPARSAPARPAARRTTSAEPEPGTQLVGDAELFDAPDANSAVIERPEEREPARRPGPAIGRS
jgi:hypothetical protein